MLTGETVSEMQTFEQLIPHLKQTKCFKNFGIEISFPNISSFNLLLYEYAKSNWLYH